jgi:nucleotide-binding universal stress UspA family protein
VGTSARAGVPGLLIGITAERMLQALDCSVLAIKPKDLLSPVH